MWLKLTLCIFFLLGVCGEELTQDLTTNELDYTELPFSITVEDGAETFKLTRVSNISSTDELFPNRIVGGQIVDISYFPYQVAILNNGQLLCGGALIRTNWVLTAAHCVEGTFRNQVTVRAGSNIWRSGGQLRRVSRAIYNGRFTGYQFDIGLIKLARPFTLTNTVQLVNLPGGPNVALPSSYAATGWGTLRDNGVRLSERLRGVQLNASSLRRCRRIFSTIGIPIGFGTLCAWTRNKDTCQGDSGGPLVSDNIVYGITSFGNGCSRGIFPGVSTDTRKFLRWINGILRRF